ncbi:MAG TPA: HEAT repeat domain-containing protein, partial [bacterium]|nr:HEAT repeat domain-containing protein [bacterium]
QDQDWQMRRFAALSLGLRGNSGASELNQLLRDPHPLVREAALSALVQMPDVSITDVSGLVNDPYWTVRLTALDLVSPGKIRGNLSPDICLDRALRDPHPLVRAKAIVDLGNLGDNRVKDIAIANLENPDWRIRCASGFTLGRVDFKDDFTQLQRALKDAQPSVRAASVFGLNQRTSLTADTQRLMSTMFTDHHWLVRDAAVSSLGNINLPGVGNIISGSLTDPSPVVRQKAILNIPADVYKTDFDLATVLRTVAVRDTSSENRVLAKLTIQVVNQDVQNNQIVDSAISGVYNGVHPFNVLGLIPKKARSLDTEETANWKIRDLCEKNGIRFSEYPWSGLMAFIPLERFSFEAYFERKVSFLGPDEAILVCALSAGNFLIEGLADPIKRLPDTDIAIRNGQVGIFSVASPLLVGNLSDIDPECVHVYIDKDPIVIGTGGRYFRNRPYDIMFSSKGYDYNLFTVHAEAINDERVVFMFKGKLNIDLPQMPKLESKAISNYGGYMGNNMGTIPHSIGGGLIGIDPNVFKLPQDMKYNQSREMQVDIPKINIKNKQ